MNLDWKQVIAALVISGITWIASQFFSAQSSISLVKLQMDQIALMLKEVRDQQKDYALKSEVERLEKRIERLEQK